ncbi:MFS transporter [Caulobacter segnis]|uniref:Major facilitator superfamily MFS_1 n=2 Tax=Caulobacter segnis TaxID=88688 RepID=D5VPK9_CAUST|nr:MFS transporter [Caulobacter segnis]ADG12432.1 major facilitator superfamily MFS_1 [Caulobacter segnis ATCC 21756]AVQ04019.1 MFS transporter [Caulobacter segnis]
MTEQTTDTKAKPEKKSLLQTLAFFGERRSLVMLGLGFASGLPYMLIFDTLSLWLRDAGLSLAVIGFFSLATLSFSFKFLWAPLIDRAKVPVLHGVLGHRRAWMLVFQTAMILGLWMISGLNPAANLALLGAVAVAVGFATASHDIVIDAWRIEVADDEEQGPMVVAYQWGFRVAMIAAGAIPLLLAERYGWNISYAAMGFVVCVGLLATLCAPREAEHTIRPIPTDDVKQSKALEIFEWLARLAILLVGALVLGSGLAGDATVLSKLVGGEALADAWTAKPNGVWLQLLGVAVGLAIVVIAAWPIPKVRTKPGVYMSKAFGEPLGEFLTRFQGVAGLILAAICVYRVSDFVLNIMNPFYRDMGFSLTEIAEIRKVFGIIASMIGVFLGGVVVARLGLMKALVIGAFAQPISNLMFALLAMSGHNIPMLFVSICLDNVAGGVAGTALIAYMSSLTSAGFTATQYALFSSLYALPGKLVASQSGRIVEASAQAAEHGGPIGMLKGLFTRLPPESFTAAGAKLGVSAQAMAAGYTAFFIYTAIIGAVAIVLSFMVAARQKATETPAKA